MTDLFNGKVKFGCLYAFDLGKLLESHLNAKFYGKVKFGCLYVCMGKAVYKVIKWEKTCSKLPN